MARSRKVRFFAITKPILNDMPSYAVLDILRYEAARPLCNAPDGWYVFEKNSENAVTLERLASFGVPTDAVQTFVGEPSSGSCPAQFRWQIETYEARVFADRSRAMTGRYV